MCTARTLHKAAAPAWVRREETWAGRFQQQEHPRADELLSSEASCPVSVFPTHAVARAKAGGSCEQSESFHRVSFIPGKKQKQNQKNYHNTTTIFSGKEQQQFLFHLSCSLCIFGKKRLVVNDQADNSPLPTNDPSHRTGEIKWMDKDGSPGVA